MRNVAFAALFVSVWTLRAVADPQIDPQNLAPPPPPDTVRFAPIDPTGGAYTSPTLLFIPAAAVPKWNVRVILSSAFQSCSASCALPSAADGAFQPGLGVELGL